MFVRTNTPLDSETVASYTVQTGVSDRPFDSGWMVMQSQTGSTAYRTGSHGLNRQTETLRVTAVVRALDGPNRGFMFYGSGSAFRGDGVSTARYGGIVFGYDESNYRVWAPNAASGRPNTLGSIINIGFGWGNEINAQTSHTAEVRVTVRVDAPTPDYDSGWFQMSAQSAALSYREATHSFGSYPARVKVLTRAQSGVNGGFVFPGVGHTMSDDDFGSVEPYGGVVFAYNSNTFRLWCPSRSNDGNNGAVINAGNPGWGQSSTMSTLQNGDVRVMAWRRRTDPWYDSGWFPMVAYTATAYKEVVHGLGSIPDYVQVVVKTAEAPNAEFHFECSGMAQNSGYEVWTQYGGCVYGFNESAVRVWAPSTDPRPGAAGVNGATIMIGDGWGGEVNSQSTVNAQGRVLVWASLSFPVDFADITVNVVSVAEPPTAVGGAVVLLQTVAPGFVVGRVTASDEDLGSVLTYRIVGGDPDGAFVIDGVTGVITTSPVSVPLLSANPRFLLLVTVTDGSGLSDTVTFSVTVALANRAPVLLGASFTVPEGSPVNALVGTEPNATGAWPPHTPPLPTPPTSMPCQPRCVLKSPMLFEGVPVAVCV
jgi:hypothetical protein